MHWPATAGVTEIEDAATAPVSSALPIAVTHTPTFTADAVTDSCAVKVVVLVTVTVTGVDVAVVPEPVAAPDWRASGVTTKPVDDTALTVPFAPRLKARPPPWPNPPVGEPEGLPEAPALPDPPPRPAKPPPAPRAKPPPAEHFPSVAGKIATVAAVTVVTAVVGVEVDGGLEVVLGAGRAMTQSPTFTAAAETLAWPVNLVEVDHETAV